MAPQATRPMVSRALERPPPLLAQTVVAAAAAVATDGAGRLLMIHCRSPYSTHDFIDILQDLPLDIASAMYVEGGPESQLYVNAGGARREFVGSFESGILESELNRRAWPIPNVVAVRRRGGADE